jgi:hypothetical protein
MAFPLQNWLKRSKSKTVRRAPRLHVFLEQLEDRRLLAAPVVPMPGVAWPPDSATTAGQSSPAASSSAPSAELNLVAAAGLFSATPGAGYTPAQIQQAYGFDQLSGLSGNKYNYAGKGETIAIVDVYADPNISHDVQQFDEQFNIAGAAGNPANTGFLTVVNQYGGSPQDVAGPGLSGWDAEESADVEWAHAIAPGANILLVQAANQDMADEDAAVQYAASQPDVCVVSMSYSSGFEQPDEDNYDSLYTTPVRHQGVAFVAASGDSGAATYYQQVSPNVLVVGGTTLPADQNGNPVRSQEVGWSLGSDAYNSSLASGGGISQYEAQPAYQQGIVTQSTTNRTYPDVAFDADPLTGVPVYDSLSTPPGLPWGQYGGTSISSPMWAGLIAIADEARAAKGESTLDGPTQLLPALYQISQADSDAFDDITQGFNGYSAGPGYDLVTGLGTPNAQNLIPDLVKIDSSPAAPATVYWTGDAGDNNWDNPGNWSLVDPAQRNVPESILPGPDDNVVIDVAGATVNHATTSYDTIRSLKVTAADVTLNIDSGTLDLSGGGTMGTFQAASPGDINLIGGFFGGVLKSADVTSGTTITVSPTEIGVIDGGVLNGTLQVPDSSTLDLEGSWTNNGTITAETGSTLILGDYWSAAASDPGAKSDAWVNHGTITAESATVELGGWLTNTDTNLSSLALGSDTVELLGTLDNRQQTLALVPGETSSTGGWILYDGRIDGGTITTTGGAALTPGGGGDYSPPASVTLDGVTLSGSLDMSVYSAYVVIVGRLTLNTDLYLGQTADLQFNGDSSVVAGALVQYATIHLGGPYAVLYNNSSPNSLLNNDPSQMATIGSGVTISGEAFTNGIFGPFDNLGTIEKNTAGQLLIYELDNDGTVKAGQSGYVVLDSQATVSEGFYGFYFFPGQPWSNNADGTITATQGATLNLYGDWTNQGTIAVDSSSTVGLGGYAYDLGSNDVGLPVVTDTSNIWTNSGTFSVAPGATVNLGDGFTTDEFESGFQQLGVDLDPSQYTVNLFGTLDNSPADNPITGGVLALTPSTGPLSLDGLCEIEGGTITTSGPDDLVFNDGTLDGVTLDGTLSDPNYSAVNIIGGLTLDTDLYVGELFFLDGSTVAVGPLVKSATIYLNGYNGGLINESSQTVTLGQGIAVSCTTQNTETTIYAMNGGLFDNFGTVEQNGPGDLYLIGVNNDGSVQASNGGIVGIDNEWTNYFNLYPPFPTPIPWSNNADGTFTATQGATLELAGVWTNQGTISVDSSSTVFLGSYVGEYAPVASNTWTNLGTISIAPGATVDLGGYFTTDEFEDHFGGQLDLSQYTVTLIGILDNSPADNPVTGGILTLDRSTGPLSLAGVIDEGTITTWGRDDLANNYGTLSGVTLDGTLDMSEPGAALYVMNGLTLDTDLNLSGAGASLNFLDGSTVAVGPGVTSATIRLSGDGAGISNDSYPTETVTIGRGITISGENPNGYISGPIDSLGTITQQGGGQLTLNDVVNGGTVRVASGGTVTVQGPFSNAGTVKIATGGTFSTSGADYTQSAGTTIVDGLLSAANVNLMGGLLTGAGTIQADVINAATVEPGDPVGTLTIQGNYTQTATGVLLTQIGGPSEFGQLAVTGTATLGGTLEVSMMKGYVPAVGNSFQILTFAQASGSFVTEVGLRLRHHRSLTPVLDTGDLTITVTD